MVSIPAFVGIAALQYADMPLCYFITASVIASGLAIKRSADPFWILSGALAGLAAWTKNEGFLFFLTMAIVLLAVQGWRSGLSGSARTMLKFAIGGLPAVAALIAFRLQVNRVSEFFVSQTMGDIIGKILDPNRWAAVAREITSSLSAQEPTLSAVVAFLLVYLWVARGPSVPSRTPLLLISSAVAALLLAQYLAIYLITPFEIDWLVQSTVARLLIHVMPLLAILFCLLIKLPDCKDMQKS
jgi:hypothetical protein